MSISSTSEFEWSMVSFAASVSTSAMFVIQVVNFLDREGIKKKKKKRRWRERLGNGYLREAINRGTAIIRENTVFNFFKSRGEGWGGLLPLSTFGFRITFPFTVNTNDKTRVEDKCQVFWELQDRFWKLKCLSVNVTGFVGGILLSAFKIVVTSGTNV